MFVWLVSTLRRPVQGMGSAAHVSINQIISTAPAEKMAALITVEYLEDRAARDSRVRFECTMSRVGDTETDDADI
jgi:hypothetical protein